MMARDRIPYCFRCHEPKPDAPLIESLTLRSGRIAERLKCPDCGHEIAFLPGK